MSEIERLVPAVDRAARVLDALETAGRPLGISELARRLGGSKSQMSGVLETLRRHGLLERDEPTKHYRLGGRLVRLGHAALTGLDLATLARPWLARLAEATGETAVLLVRAGDRALILDKAEVGTPAVRVSVPVGLRIPLSAGAVGKVFADADEVRRVGYGLDDQEYLDGVRAAAAPILDSRGALAGVLLVVGLAGSFPRARLAVVGEAVARTATGLSAELGAPGAS